MTTMRAPIIKDADGNFVVVAEIAALKCRGKKFKFTLTSGKTVTLRESKDDEKDANLVGQVDMYFGSDD